MKELYIPGFNIELTAQSGQCFRFQKIDDNFYQIIARQKRLLIEVRNNDRFLLDCNEESYDNVWHEYFDMDRDYSIIMIDIPEDDAFLQEALCHTSGLRILRQEPWECLVSFIISQRKNIPAIKGCVEALSRRFGEPLGDGFFAFPTPDALAASTIEELNACSLGYRSAYILKSARMAASRQVDLHKLRKLPDAQLKAALLLFPGVGTKVADCVMLFAYARTSAFPRDVWINRVIDTHYGGESPAESLGEYAGILQQCMFCYIRSSQYKKSHS
ncbi:MAG: DNA-3-methyladenine glycosylase 2 family protein [Clostridiales bacterium]|nr:DNA-3-methyladenine glycosylase 2 family protein [Clostridiales bacterium]